MAWSKDIVLDEEALGEIQAIFMRLGRYCRLNKNRMGRDMDRTALALAEKGQGIAWEMRARQLPGGLYYEGDDGKTEMD